MDNPSSKYHCLLIYLVLVVSTLTVYWQVHNYDFSSYDDGEYVQNNEQVKAGLTRDSIIWAFTSAGYAANWHPLTWLSLMLDCQLFGVNPGWHHLINLFLHIANALLLFAVLKQMTGSVWRSAFVAAAFALHPLHVESVAWISERKDVLSTLFWILTMGAYAHYAKRPSISRYLLTLLIFALGLMAKPMLVTLPLVLLLLDYWPLDRFRNSSITNANQQTQNSPNTYFQWRALYCLMREKVPFLILSATSCIITSLVQTKAKSSLDILFLSSRIANALISYVKYIEKMIWPSQLAIYYHHPGNNVSMWQAVGAALLLLVITALIIRLARSHRYLPLGWFWYLGTLVPVIGLVQVGLQAMADRYSYVPLTGLFIIIAWGVPELLKEWRLRRVALGISALVVLLALSICTYFQLHHWYDGVTNYERVIEVGGDNAEIRRKLAIAFRLRGKFDQVFLQLDKSLQFDPYHHETLNTLAWILATTNDPNIRDPNAAIKHAEKACEIDNYESSAYLDTLAAAYAAAGRFPEAIIMAGEAIQMAPDNKKEDYQDRLEMYEAGKPYIRSSP